MTQQKSNHIRKPTTRFGYCGLGFGSLMIDIDQNLAYACKDCLERFRKPILPSRTKHPFAGRKRKPQSKAKIK